VAFLFREQTRRMSISLRRPTNLQPKTTVSCGDNFPPNGYPICMTTHAAHPVYQICIAETLDAGWAVWFEGLALAPLPEGGTALHGQVVDQAALHGLLNKVQSLNLTLLSVQRVDRRDDTF
jgi:hypothetical protein